jgi:peptidoglycan glycosyltransferase
MLALALTYQQTVAATAYRTDHRNPRVIAARQELPRGRIVSADGVVLAESVQAADSTYRRTYPEGEAFAHVVGYSTLLFGDTGVEDRRGEDLSSGDDGSLRAALLRAFGADPGPQDVRLTIRSDLQRAAAAALGAQRGAVVALDPDTGAVLAMVSSPSYDPNALTGESALENGAALVAAPDRPLLNRATEATYAPGSTFKLVTATAGLEADYVDPETRLPDSAELTLPGSTSTITNPGGGPCGNGDSITLQRALAVSCNTAFADLGMRLGAAALVTAAETAGWNDQIPFELGAVPSPMPPVSVLENDLPAVAQTALGQRDVRATPLQMALLTAAVANEGVAMAPYLVAEVVDGSGAVVHRAEPAPWRRAMSADTADALAVMMEAVITEGTGAAAAVPGLRLAGKTGTAEVPGGAPDVWFVVFGPTDADPGAGRITVAVVVESGGNRGDQGTGGSVAAPIARAVVAAWNGTATG